MRRYYVGLNCYYTYTRLYGVMSPKNISLQAISVTTCSSPNGINHRTGDCTVGFVVACRACTVCDTAMQARVHRRQRRIPNGLKNVSPRVGRGSLNKSQPQPYLVSITILTWICLTRGWYALHRSHRTL
jgi:hypothetical protein